MYERSPDRDGLMSKDDFMMRGFDRITRADDFRTSGAFYVGDTINRGFPEGASLCHLLVFQTYANYVVQILTGINSGTWIRTFTDMWREWTKIG